MMEYCENTASANDILVHLKSCAPDFYKDLSGRIDISKYASKLAEKSFRHEMWDGEHLVGLVAVYYNHDAEGIHFISDVSVSQSHTGQGLARQLMDHMLTRAGNGHQIQLEVNPSNQPALNLYASYGFKPLEGRLGYWVRGI